MAAAARGGCSGGESAAADTWVRCRDDRAGVDGRSGGRGCGCGCGRGAVQQRPTTAPASRQYLGKATAPGAMTSHAPCLPAQALLCAALLALGLVQAPGARAASAAGGETAASANSLAAAPGGAAASDAAQEVAGELLERLENEAGSGGLPEDELEFYKRLYDFGVGKRAYSYVSEYKRLPVYNFGLGKRAGGRQYGFGLGKRAGGRHYGFGLGKRTPDDEEDYYFPEEEDQEEIPEENFEDGDGIDKSDRQFSSGQGKRSRPFSFGLGKRAGMYSFGLGKRAQHMYSFGLGKRGEGRMYSFGLGKRPHYDRVSGSRFNFGLGKRADVSGSYPLSDLGEDSKRAPEHRFAFGLGKREVSPNELEAVREEQSHRQEQDEHKAAAQHKQLVGATTGDAERPPNDADTNGKHAVKRSLHYGFGIGKRTNDAFSLDEDPEDEDREAVSEDFTRYVRRPYSFGLGKRIPMYDFGIGKRAER